MTTATTTTTTTTTKARLITLTDRPPVKIREDVWPVVASGSADDDDSGGRGNPPNRTWKRQLRVRQHVDGRTIVYGVYDYDTAFQGERGAAAKRGTYLDEPPTPAQIVVAIRTVAAELAEAEGSAPVHADRQDVGRWREAAQECIASLPPEPL